MYIDLPPEFALDTETTGLSWLKDKVFGFSVYHPELPLIEGQQEPGRYFDVRRFPKALQWLEVQIAKAKRVYCHNAKFDMHMLREAGVKYDPSKFRCTMVRAALINEHEEEYSLDYLGEKYVGIKKIEMSKKDKENMASLPVSVVAPYAIRDTKVCWYLAKWQELQLDEQDLRRVDDLEARILEINVDAERRGIRVDIEAAHAAIPALEAEFNKIMDKIREMAGFDLNINSAPQIRNAFKAEKGADGFWRASDGTRLEETASGAPSFNKDTLLMMTHPMAKLIVQAREMSRLSGTFLKQHVIGHAHQAPNGCWYVHPNINQTRGETGFGTVTGRMSYNDPAMQQIPSRNEAAASIMRPIFLPEPGHEWVYGDLDQHEFRVFAHYANSPKIIQMYNEDPDVDFHAMVAKLTGLPRSAKRSGEPNAKQVNLGLVFNMGSGLLAKKMGLPFEEREFRTRRGEIKKYLAGGEEIKDVLDNYHRQIPGVKEMAERASSIAQRRGYVRTILGRRIRFPDPEFAYKASGLIYQGSSADLNKMNIVTVYDTLKGTDSHYTMNVHDEYSASMAPGDEHLIKEIQKQIQNRGMLRVPIRIDFTAGKDWWDAAKNGRKLT